MEISLQYDIFYTVASRSSCSLWRFEMFKSSIKALWRFWWKTFMRYKLNWAQMNAVVFIWCHMCMWLILPWGNVDYISDVAPLLLRWFLILLCRIVLHLTIDHTILMFRHVSCIRIRERFLPCPRKGEIIALESCVPGKAESSRRNLASQERAGIILRKLDISIVTVSESPSEKIHHYSTCSRFFNV